MDLAEAREAYKQDLTRALMLVEAAEKDQRPARGVEGAPSLVELEVGIHGLRLEETYREYMQALMVAHPLPSWATGEPPDFATLFRESFFSAN